MDDLSGLDWSKPAVAPPKQQPFPIRPPSNQPMTSLRPTPSQPSATAFLPAKPAQQKDSFSNLASFGPTKASQNLTLAERQAQLEAEKRKRDDERRKLSEAQFGSGQQWDALGSRAFTPSPSLQPPVATPDGDDLFAAFNKDTKVDNASHYPPPSSERSISSESRQLDLRDPTAWKPMTTEDDDDDPFGLKELKPSTAAPATATDEDDFLGDLAKPVDEVRRKQQEAARPEPGKPIEPDDTSSSEEELRQSDDALNHAVAQLVDYGFSPADALRGLKHSGGGSANPQAAANWLLDEAHRKAERKSQGRNASAGPRDEADFTKSAAVVGNSFFKTANSLWKTGQKRMQQAVADFQQEGDTGRPRWMRDGRQEQRTSAGDARATDEALALESGGKPALAHADRKAMPQQSSGRGTWSAPSSGSQSRSSPAPRWQQQAQPPAVSDARSRLNRLAADDDNDNFSSHVRRKKPDKQADLMLDITEAPKPSRPAVAHRPAQAQTRNNPPKVAPRRVPPIDPAALQASTRYRIQGTAHFKRGDYATAHSSYSSSMAGVPATHPLMVVLLTNRALTALKTGEPKQAVSDADEALKLIGPGRGRDETVAVRGEDGQEETKPLTELYGKALGRKAEALEQMEKWADAGAVWHLCVEAGVGGPTAVKGRQRCQEALAPKKKPATTTTAKTAVKRPTRPSAPAKTSAAVERLREANQAAAREEDEKFALTEQVDSRISAWRDGKRDNLRALLGSLDKVLWADSGWNTVGMHELVMPNRVKVVYMKAIAKTHPDKLPQDASTEVRLVAGLVFSTLNESWDRFKADNGL